jgi:SAM-dependent methyltransferase
MLQSDHDIYATAPMRRLLDDQTRCMVSRLQHCFGTHALLLSASPDDAPPVLPMLGYWARLHVDDTHCHGDLTSSAIEPLPFVDDAFELVLLRHALEVVLNASALLGEAVRVLAPGGLLVVTGLHPVSGWAPWFCWNSRDQRRFLHMPQRVGHRLQQAGIEVELVQRTGSFWPGNAAAKHDGSLIGGGYVLIARKRRRVVLPLRKMPVSIRVSANAGLSPGTRRSSAS